MRYSNDDNIAYSPLYNVIVLVSSAFKTQNRCQIAMSLNKFLWFVPLFVYTSVLVTGLKSSWPDIFTADLSAIILSPENI